MTQKTTIFLPLWLGHMDMSHVFGEMVFCRDLRESGRGGEIRTHDPLYPKQVRYQTAPRPDTVVSLGNWIEKEKGFSHTAGGFFVYGQSKMAQNRIRTHFQS